MKSVTVKKSKRLIENRFYKDENLTSENIIKAFNLTGWQETRDWLGRDDDLTFIKSPSRISFDIVPNSGYNFTYYKDFEPKEYAADYIIYSGRNLKELEMDIEDFNNLEAKDFLKYKAPEFPWTKTIQETEMLENKELKEETELVRYATLSSLLRKAKDQKVKQTEDHYAEVSVKAYCGGPFELKISYANSDENEPAFFYVTFDYEDDEDHNPSIESRLYDAIKDKFREAGLLKEMQAEGLHVESSEIQKLEDITNGQAFLFENKNSNKTKTNLKKSFKEDISNSYYVTPEQREEAMVKARAIHNALWNAGLQDIDMELESFISNQPNEKAWYYALVDGTAENFVDERTDEDWRQYLTESKRLKGDKNSRSTLREALTQKQKNHVLNYVKENSFFPCDNGKYFYFLVPVDVKHIKMTPKFKKQLKDEGLYGNTFIGGMTDTAELPIDMMWLPIYGDPDRYVTKWLSHSFNSCFDRDLRDRGRGLSKRLDLDKISEVRKLKEARTRNPGRKDQINPTFIAQQTTIFFEDEGFYKVDYKAHPKPNTFRIFNDPTGIDLNINVAINGDYEDDILINTFFDSRCGSGYVIQTQTLEGPVEWAGFDKSEFKEDLEDAWVTAKKFFEANKDKHSLETWLNREVGQSISQDEIHDIIEKAYQQGPKDYFTKLLSREEFDAYLNQLIK